MERKQKYNINKSKTGRTYEGIVFDSALEMGYYRDVIVPGLKRGEFISCERQKSYVLQDAFIRNGKKIQAIIYKADFYLINRNGEEIVIDIKGCPDSEAKLKRKMFWYVYPNIKYDWIGYSKIDGGWVLYETILQGRKSRKKVKRN